MTPMTALSSVCALAAAVLHDLLPGMTTTIGVLAIFSAVGFASVISPRGEADEHFVH